MAPRFTGEKAIGFFASEDCPTWEALKAKSLETGIDFLQDPDLENSVFRFLIPEGMNLPGFINEKMDPERFRFYALFLRENLPAIAIEYRQTDLNNLIQTTLTTLKNA